jgi:hypothetical protein
MCVIYQIVALQVQEFASENPGKFVQFQFQLDFPYSNPKYNKILVYKDIGARMKEFKKNQSVVVLLAPV